jgi:hypothetical protein
MNLQRLLAENMIRFNTKNLNENQIRKLLKEQVAINTSQKGTGDLGKFVAKPEGWGPNFTSLVNTAKGMLNKAGIKEELMKVPSNSILTIDASHCKHIDYDVIELIKEFKEIKAKLKNIQVDLINFENKI